MRNILTTILLTCCLASATLAANEKLVLVTGKNSNIEKISNKQLKRAYIGLTLKQNNNLIKPIRNHSDNFAHEVFLQNVIVMSSRIYERQLTTRALRKGSKRPVSKSTQKKLVSHLNNTENSISYMWEREALKSKSVKIIQSLWSASKK